MEIVKYKKKNKNECTLLLSDNTSLSFYDDTILHFDLLLKKEIDTTLIKEASLYNQNLSAYYAGLKDITTKLRTEKELEKRLKQKHYSTENINFALHKLKEQGYINKKIYLQCYLNDAVNLTSKGPLKIIKELEKLGYTEEEVKLELEKYTEEWPLKIKKIINKKIKANHNMSSAMLKVKCERECLNLGFLSKDVKEVLETVEFPEDDAILQKEFNKYQRKYQKLSSQEAREKITLALYRKGFSLADIKKLYP